MNFLAFPSVKFRETWQTGTEKMFYFSRSSFFREIYTTSIFAAVKDIILQK